MHFEHLHIVWLASSVFFILGQIAYSVLISRFPQDLDKAISYNRTIRLPLYWLSRINLITILFAIIMTWIYFITAFQSIYTYIVSIVITILGLGLFFLMDKTMYDFFMDKLSSSAEEEEE